MPVDEHRPSAPWYHVQRPLASLKDLGAPPPAPHPVAVPRKSGLARESITVGPGIVVGSRNAGGLTFAAYCELLQCLQGTSAARQTFGGTVKKPSKRRKASSRLLVGSS